MRVTNLIHNALLLEELDIPIEKVSAARNGNLSSGQPLYVPFCCRETIHYSLVSHISDAEELC